MYNVLAIPFLGNLDTKSDPKSLAIGKLQSLENGIFTRYGSISKRSGYIGVALKDDSNLNIENYKTVASRNDNELFLTTLNSIYSYNSNTSSFVNRGAFDYVNITGKEVTRDVNEQTIADRAEANNIIVYAWTDSRGGIFYSVVDKITETKLIDKVQISDTGTKPRCVAIGNFLHVIYCELGATDLVSQVIPTFNPTNPSSIIIVSDLATELFDIHQGHDNSYAVFCYESTATNNIRFGRLEANGATEDVSDSGASVTGITSISCYSNADTMVVAWAKPSEFIIGLEFIDNPASLLTWSKTENVTADFPGPVTVTLSEDSANYYVFYTDVEDTASIDNFITQVSGTITPFTETAQVVTRQGILGSQAFRFNGNNYLVVSYETYVGLQNCYFLVRAPADDVNKVVGQFNLGEGLSLDSSENHLRSVWLVDGKFTFLSSFRRRFQLQHGAQTAVAPKGINDTSDITYEWAALQDIVFDFNSDKYTFSTLNRTAYTAGGVIWHYDSGTPCEAAFTLFPEPDITIGAVTHNALTVNAGSIGPGTRAYRIYYEWLNDLGQRVRSAALTFSHDEIVSSGKVTIRIPTLQFTRKDVIITVYRTVNNGTSFHRISSVNPTATGDNGFVYNDPTSAAVNFVDNLPDANITDNELDPGDAVLPAINIPPGNIITNSRRRVFIAGGMIPDNRVYYSKLLVSQVEFNDRLYITIDDKGGLVTGLAELNDRLVIFKERNIFVVAGDGPNNLGQGDFQQPVEITTDVGCVDARSIVEIPQGIMFKSNRGIYLLHDNFQVTYIGQAVEAYNNQNITSAEIIPDKNLVIFLTDKGRTLAFDYLFGQWSTFTYHEGNSATLWNNTYVYLNDSQLLINDENTYQDAGLSYALKFKTAPIRPENLQQRFFVHRLLTMGEYFSDHDIKLSIYRNRDRFPINEKIFDTDNFIDKSTWGDQPTWGADSVWGGSGQDYQFEYTPAHQEYQSITIEITEISSATLSGKAFELTELALEWSEAGGLAQIGNSRRG